MTDLAPTYAQAKEIQQQITLYHWQASATEITNAAHQGCSQLIF